MKHILLMRHAKSSWKDLSQGDKSRPLNKRGLRDAPMMFEQLVRFFPKPSQIFCSDAVRTQETLSFGKAYIGQAALNLESSLYHGSVEDYESCIYGTGEQHDCILLIGHNPTMTYMANLAGGDMDNVATSGIIHLRSPINDWTSFNFESSEFVKYIYPKMFLNDR